MERELWRRISQAVTGVDRQFHQGRYTHSVGRIVRVYLWAALNDRPVYWACRRENWRGVRPPRHLPDQSRMSRRLRQADTQEFLAKLHARFGQSKESELVKFVDGKPLPISRHSQDADAAVGRGAGGFDKGYKLHAIYGQSGRVLAWQVHPMNVDERKTAMTLVTQLPDEGYLLGDASYDGNALYAAAREHGHQLIAPHRYGTPGQVGHRRHSPARLRGIALLEDPSEFGRSLFQQRGRIESRFGNLSSFGGGLICLPPWVRTLPRVRFYVSAKLLIRTVRDELIRAPAA